MEASIDNTFVSPYLYFFSYKKPSWWWWYACHLAIYRPIYIWRMEIKLKDTRTPLHICRPGLPSFILISNKPHCWAIKKGSLWNKLAWWPLPASSIPMAPLRPTTDHHHAPLSSPYLLFLEISLVFTHGITPAWVNHNKCFIKKCILMFRAIHGHLASTPTED